jgi:tetratricopeptide (TPR) repeat protein
MSRLRAVLLTASLSLLPVLPVIASTPRPRVVGRAAPGPDRPQVAKGRDPNDWEAYFDLGVEALERRPTFAAAAFYWAGRLNPERAEPPFWEWVAFHSSDGSRFEAYLREDEKVLARPEVRHADSLRYRSVLRNPFVPQGAIVAAYDRLPGKWGFDDLTHAWITYARADFANAAELFGQIIARDPEARRWLRYDRATALVMLRQYVPAQRELDLLIESLARDDKKKTVRVYQSRELLEYARGLVAWSRRDVGEAKRNFGQALAENLAFAPAHVQLGSIAIQQRDTVTALQEFELAATLDASDAPTRLQYGRALHAARRSQDAIEHLSAATTLEPFYADAYESLGEALEAVGRTNDAVAAYRSAQKNAPASSAVASKALARLSALSKS